MAERVKKIGKQLLDIWSKYTNKQKTLIISVVGVVILAFVLLYVLINRVDYTTLMKCETSAEASEIKKVLNSNNIPNKVDMGTYTISVETKKSEDAFWLIQDAGISTDEISLEELFKTSIGQTNADHTLKVTLFFQNKIKNKLKQMDGIDDAEVYYIPKDSNTIITKEEVNTAASVMLTINDKFQPQTAETIAEVVAAIIGNTSSDTIKVCDQAGNLLFGGNNDLYSGTVSGKLDYEQRLRNTFNNNIYMMLVKNDYQDVEIAPNLKLNLDVVDSMYTEYTTTNGAEQGLLSHSYSYSTENTDSSGGVPGTTSNDGTGYDITDPSSSDSKSDTLENDYLPNQRITNTKYEVGAVVPEKSSIAIVLTKINQKTQKELQDSGALNGTTYDAYVEANSDPVPGTADPNIIPMVKSATGISENNITVTYWNKTVFIPTTKTPISWSNYMMIALAVLIVGLLLFVVFKGVKPVEVTELEPELSVEQLLATTKENQSIEDIEFNEVSEVRRMIEKFVDEKPEAVAQLLRNWLNEDWS